MTNKLTAKLTQAAKSEIALKAPPLLAKTLKYPINDNSPPSGGYGLVCSFPSYLKFDLVLGSYGLDLHNVNGLLGGFVFFFENWLRKTKQVSRFSEDKYTATLNMLLANLRLAHLDGKQLLTPLRREKTTQNNPENISYTTIKNVLNYLTKNGYIMLVKGKANEYQNICTWCEPTAALIHWFERHSLRAQLHNKADLVILRQEIKDVLNNGRRTKIQIAIPKKDRKRASLYAESVSRYNATWFNYIATLDGKYITPWCRRIFNESLDYGGRYYGGFQQLNKAQRGRILINNMATAEPDFSGYHINILYAWEGVQLKGDPYDIRDYARDTIKAVMLPLLNTQSLNQLAGHINKSSTSESKLAHAEWVAASTENQLKIAQGVKGLNLKKPEFLKGFIEGIPEGTDGHKLIEAIKQKHSLIAYHFGTDNLGVRLQNYDSRIMSDILDTLSELNIAALPVHDSIRCLGSDSLRVAEIMRDAYKRITGFDIVVK